MDNFLSRTVSFLVVIVENIDTEIVGKSICYSEIKSRYGNIFPNIFLALEGIANRAENVDFQALLVEFDKWTSHQPGRSDSHNVYASSLVWLVRPLIVKLINNKISITTKFPCLSAYLDYDINKVGDLLPYLDVRSKMMSELQESEYKNSLYVEKLKEKCTSLEREVTRLQCDSIPKSLSEAKLLQIKTILKDATAELKEKISNQNVTIATMKVEISSATESIVVLQDYNSKLSSEIRNTSSVLTGRCESAERELARIDKECISLSNALVYARQMVGSVCSEMAEVLEENGKLRADRETTFRELNYHRYLYAKRNRGVMYMETILKE